MTRILPGGEAARASTHAPSPLSRRRFVLCGLATATLAACGSGGDGDGDGGGGGAMPSKLTITRFDNGSGQVGGGGGLQAAHVVDAGVLVETSLQSASGEHRVFYDAAGLVQAVRLADGNTLHLSYPRSGRVDMVAVDPAGVLQWGAALYEQGGQLLFAPLGSSLSTTQINATVSGPLSGALTVNGDPDDPLAGIDTARARVVDAKLVDLLMAEVATPQRAPAGRAVALATPGQQIATGIVQAGILAPVLVNAGLNLGAIVGVAAAGSLLVTAGSAALVGAGAYALYTGISNIRGGAVRGLMSESLDALGDADATQSSLFDRIAAAVGSMAASGQALAERALDVASRSPAAGETSPAALGFGSLPAISGALAGVTSRVRGVLVDSAGRLFAGSGQLDAGGALALGMSANDGTQLSLAAQRSGSDVTGTFTVGGQTGNVLGRSAPVGQCNTSSSSGGAGTFSYAYNVGNGSGSFPFSYEMYSIPDQARIVDIAGRELFNTGRLVSGGTSMTVLLAGEANVVVLINAPNSGTRWDFTIGCSR